MRSGLFLAVLPVLLALSTPAFARGGTLDSILPGIRAEHPGRLSDAEPFTAPDGSTHYRIKWMTREGRILYFDADARSGRYSNSGGDGSGWRRRDDEPRGTSRWRGEPDAREDDGGRRRDWNGTGGGEWNRGGDWGGDRAGANWPGRGSEGDWHGRGDGDWGGRGGNWRGGRDGGDNGGSHHHHGG